jgi:hypothetical protein
MESYFIQYLNLDKIESLYRKIPQLEEESKLSDGDKEYLKGANDALLAILGVNNKLAKLTGIDTKDEEHETMILSAQAALVASSPGCQVIYQDPRIGEMFFYGDYECFDEEPTETSSDI